MHRALLFTLMIFTVFIAHAAKVQSFSDNEDLTVELSKSNYNRLFVKGDLIEKTHFPDNTLSIQNDPDGSVYVDLLSTEPFTVFVSTKSGHHFSMTVNPVEGLGKTVEFTPKTPTVQARAFEKKAPPDETITKLIQAMMNNQMPLGYGLKSPFSTYKPFNKELTFRVSKQFIGEGFIGEVVTLYNRSNKPVKLDEAWFKNQDIRAVAFSEPTLNPKGQEMIYLVKERAHA